MKKLYILTIAAAMLSMFVSCEEAAPEPTPEPSKKFTAVLASRQAVFTYGDTATVNYTYTGGQENAVTVTFPDDTNFVFSYINNSEGKEGVIKIASRKKDNKRAESAIKVTFKNGAESSVGDLYVTMNRKADPTKLPVLTFAEDYEGSLVFPEAREDKLLGIDFTVSGGPATELVVTENKGIVTKAVLAADGKSGHIDIAASADNWKTIPFAVKVSNDEGTDVEDFNITRAYIAVNFDCTKTLDLPLNGGYSNVVIESTVPYTVKSEALASDDGWFMVDSNKEGITVSALANGTYYLNYGRITITDKEGLEKPFKIDVYQPHVATTKAQDREAAVAHYYSANMSQWVTLGGWTDGANFKRWNTDADLSLWAGLEISDYSGRVYRFNICNNPGDPRPCGTLAAEFGLMDYLQWIESQSTSYTGEIPRSFKNLLSVHTMELHCLTTDGNGKDLGLGTSCGFKGRLDAGWLDVLTRKGSLKNLELEHNWLEGPIPACLAEYGSVKGRKYQLRGNHLSGQVPQEVADSYFWNQPCTLGWYKDKGTWGDYNLYQADNYALWIGEKPENVIQVGDHWEWKPGTNPYPKYASCSDR